MKSTMAQRSDISRSIWITRIAFGLAIALVVARATMSQMLRDPFEVQPGTQPAPRGLGASGSVLLDLLMCLPAVLVLVRSSIDRAYLIFFTRVHVFAFALAAWIVMSTFWASDRFAAAVESTHWAAAIVLLWSVSQLVDSWTRFRLVGAVCFGTLLILTAHGIIYRFVDVPEQRQSFLENENRIYSERGWQPESFIAKQFKRKVMSGEVIGFSASPNTYAMMLVLLGLVAAGLAAQRISDRDEWGWPTAILVIIPPALLMLWLTQCRAALATPIIGLGLLVVASQWADRKTLPLAWLLAMHRRIYWIVVAIILLGVSALIGQGLLHGSLFHDSLTFRWRYWVGAMRVFPGHWLSGVGFANFGAHYLSVRLPIASEEIKDPHNFLVRILVETGAVGAVLLVCWMMRLWWEMTCPKTIADSEERPSPHPLLAALAIAAGAMLINTLASVDLSQTTPWILLEVLKRVLWLGLLFTGIVVGDMRSSSRQVFDDRPAPWLLWAMLTSLAVFFLHNTIEFGFFESGPLGTFAILAGAALGVRGVKSRFGSKWGLTSIAIVMWLLMAAFWVKPLLYSEGQAQAGDDDLQANRATEAGQEYSNALWGLPLRNADYAMKLAVSRAYAHESTPRVLDALDEAIAADPMCLKAYLTRAQFRMQSLTPDIEKVRNDYLMAIALNPNDVDVRTDYGGVLERLGFKQQAADAYRAALEKNDGLSPDEPKRLTADQVRALQTRITSLQTQ